MRKRRLEEKTSFFNTCESEGEPHSPHNQKPQTPFCRPGSPFSALSSLNHEVYKNDLTCIQEPVNEEEESELVLVTEERKENEDDEDEEEAPMYVRELYKFLGPDLAEYFLHPTSKDLITSSPKKKLFQTPTGAGDLWKLLRKNSQRKLSREDSKLSTTSKGSGFVRLPKSRFEESVNLYNKTIGLMYRAAEVNQNKASLIMTNNPLPDLNSWQWKDTPMRYLCKEAFERSSDSNKHLHLPPLKFHKNQLTGIARKASNVNTGSTKAGKRTYRFASEDSFKGTGQFSKRCAERKEQNLRPKQFYATKAVPKPVGTGNADVKQGCSDDSLESKASWERLSYSTNSGSKHSVSVPGDGDFRHGKASQWLFK
ncbi:testis-specific gene 13 protein isoform X2 [Microcaecilia unicolor]|uniref:Testis-specific gene 13 protein-like isoform X2 n=1 Tax=Microcaecilia unicolor TaxID=1415580 RepID=A0A6P7Z627_9AMPH|nr:testis-specific gene 13 protein-like isoform X2 [Microcaecilia unicolor]